MNKIMCGDAFAILKTLPSTCVQCAITSPPYFGLRDYGVEGQMGLEDTPEAYIARLVEVFREVRRVLRDDGTLWVNIGDSYAGSGKGPTGFNGVGNQEQRQGFHSPKVVIPDTMKPKDLIGIPWLLAFALRSDGWYLRSDIIWHKPNCMPESVEDRPTKSHEYIFLLSKSERYFYDADAIAEPVTSIDRRGYQRIAYMGKGNPETRAFSNDATWLGQSTDGSRNKRSVWTVSTMPYSEAHFATFPPKLIEPCILAGTSARACEQCGAPWERVTEHTPMVIRNGPKSGGYGSRTTDDLSGTMIAPAETRTIGWQPTCTHSNTGSGSCIVLDPFCGAGTVPLVSLKYHRQYIGIELNASYVELINKRIHTTQPVLWEVSA